MNKLYRFCLLTFLCLGISSGAALAQCCGQPLSPVPMTTGCGDFTLCLTGYDNCPVTNIWTFGLPQVNYPRQGNCISITGLTPGTNYQFFIMVGVTGCSNYFEPFNYTVPDCGTDPCCDAIMTAEADGTGECGELKVCLEGIDLCDVTAIIPTYDNFSNTATHSIDGNCITFSGLDVNATFNYSITVEIDGCDDKTVSGSYNVTADGCDPCCIPPDISTVTVNQIPGWNYIRICMPQSPCPDQENLIYNVSFLEQCGEDPGFYSITSSTSSCLYLKFKECCTYRFSVSYRSTVCSDVLWSQETEWEAPCDGGSPVYDEPGIGFVTEDELPAELRRVLNTKAQVSPNPFQADFRIQLEAQQAEAFELMIYDLQGKLITRTNGELSKGQNSLRVTDLQDLPSGSYFYQLNSEHHSVSDRLIKL